MSGTRWMATAHVKRRLDGRLRLVILNEISDISASKDGMCVVRKSIIIACSPDDCLFWETFRFRSIAGFVEKWPSAGHGMQFAKRLQQQSSTTYSTAPPITTKTTTSNSTSGHNNNNNTNINGSSTSNSNNNSSGGRIGSRTATENNSYTIELQSE